jgi:uncharacterized protein YmfQ (DUF2313 family)
MPIGDEIIGNSPIGDGAGAGEAAPVPEHYSVLKRLFPAEVGGVFDQDITIEAAHLDALKLAAEYAVNEFFPDTAIQTINEWEKRYGIISDSSLSLGARRQAAVQKRRLRKRLDVSYFIELAATVGYTIDIEEMPPNSADYGGGDETIHIWRVHAPIGAKTIVEFTAGDSAAGDLLTDWADEATLETLFNKLKPAHTHIYFLYE